MVIKRGNVRVLEGHIIAISSNSSTDFKAFGVDVEDDGYVILHLISGGEIVINTTEPEKEATEWAILTNLA